MHNKSIKENRRKLDKNSILDNLIKLLAAILQYVYIYINNKQKNFAIIPNV